MIKHANLHQDPQIITELLPCGLFKSDDPAAAFRLGAGWYPGNQGRRTLVLFDQIE